MGARRGDRRADSGSGSNREVSYLQYWEERMEISKEWAEGVGGGGDQAKARFNGSTNT